nr:hypothetical protein Q903MT_gene1159 [Picea sitchensis]
MPLTSSLGPETPPFLVNSYLAGIAFGPSALEPTYALRLLGTAFETALGGNSLWALRIQTYVSE